MSKVMIAFVSFSLGVLTSSLFVLPGSRASTVAQVPTPPGAGSLAPVVLPVSQHLEKFSLSGESSPFALDGAECDKCVFKGAAFQYGGGSLRLTDFKFLGPIRVEYVGAAANTMRFNYFLQALAAGKLPKNPSKGSIIQVLTFEESRSGSFGTD